MRVTLWLEELRDDLKFAVRQLKSSPAFTLVATLTLALGIGANSAIFALVDATLLRPLPFGDPDRLVSISENSATTARSYVSPLNMLDWNARSRTFEKIAGFTPSVGQMVMAGADGNAETVSRQWVTAGIFDVLGVILFRLFVRLRDTHQLQKTHAVRVLVAAFFGTNLPIFVAHGLGDALVAEIAQEAVAVVVLGGIVERAGAAGAGNPYRRVRLLNGPGP